MHAHIMPQPSHPPLAPARPASFDGAYFDDDLPPELFDEDEDREDLTAYIHIAENALQD